MSGENFHKPGTDEAEFIRLVYSRIISKLSFYEVAILRAISQPSPDYVGLAETLRSQQKDNDLVMNEILGIEAAELLQKILP